MSSVNYDLCIIDCHCYSYSNDVADDVIYQLNSSDKITFTEVVDNEYVVGSTVIDDIPVNGNLITKSGTVTLKVSNDKTVYVDNISKSEDGGVNNVSIGKNSEANINESFTDGDAAIFSAIDSVVRALGKMISAIAQPVLKVLGVA